jgi:predicted PurR-regulated permease PerM
VVLVAIVFAEGIRPLVHRLQARRVPQALGIVIVYVGIIAFFGLMITLLVQPIVSEAQSLVNNFGTYKSEFLSFFNNLQSTFHFNVDVSSQVTNFLGTSCWRSAAPSSRCWSTSSSPWCSASSGW